jgi:hypothetical protein
MLSARLLSPLVHVLSCSPPGRAPTWMCAVRLPRTGGEIVYGDDTIMAEKEHGSVSVGVQEVLRWGVSRELADGICCFNRQGAEPSNYFAECLEFTKRVGWARGREVDNGPIVFYDSVHSRPCFVAPVGRSSDEFLSESLRHGWPSFRADEVSWDYVRVLSDREVVTIDGVHLGHKIDDTSGARYCINLCCVAGSPAAAPVADSTPIQAAWPLLHEVAGEARWAGKMRYAAGDAMERTPFVLDGSTSVSIKGSMCTIASTITLPNGAAREVVMTGELSDEPGAVATLEREDGGGPISLRLSEHTEARTLLIRELNVTTGKTILSSSLVLAYDDEDDGPDRAPVLLQTAHELGESGEVRGVQMWRLHPSGHAAWHAEVQHDEEAYMYSGSEL